MASPVHQLLRRSSRHSPTGPTGPAPATTQVVQGAVMGVMSPPTTPVQAHLSAPAVAQPLAGPSTTPRRSLRFTDATESPTAPVAAPTTPVQSAATEVASSSSRQATPSPKPSADQPAAAAAATTPVQPGATPSTPIQSTDAAVPSSQPTTNHPQATTTSTSQEGVEPVQPTGPRRSDRIAHAVAAATSTSHQTPPRSAARSKRARAVDHGVDEIIGSRVRRARTEHSLEAGPISGSSSTPTRRAARKAADRKRRVSSKKIASGNPPDPLPAAIAKKSPVSLSPHAVSRPSKRGLADDAEVVADDDRRKRARVNSLLVPSLSSPTQAGYTTRSVIRAEIKAGGWAFLEGPNGERRRRSIRHLPVA